MKGLRFERLAIEDDCESLVAGHTSAEEWNRADGFFPDATVRAVTEAEVRAVLPGLWR